VQATPATCNSWQVPKSNYFDERIAKTYEAKWPHLFEPSMVDPAVDFLANLAGTGAALELGIGTGRLAIPLNQRGVPVHGIELSPAMVAEMRTRPGGDAIGVTLGDFTTARVDGSFRLAYLVRNTIMNLTTQDEQVACFENVARHLDTEGTFVMEVVVPALRRLPPGERFQPFDVSATHVGFDEYTDLVNQNLVSHHYWISDAQTEAFASPFRFVWPSELDLMARIAGMVLSERWSDWDRQPFTADSTSHISVWRKVR
jgi:hypothetical protein